MLSGSSNRTLRPCWACRVVGLLLLLLQLVQQTAAAWTGYGGPPAGLPQALFLGQGPLGALGRSYTALEVRPQPLFFAVAARVAYGLPLVV